MSLLETVKVFTRMSGSALDAQWEVLIEAALQDMLDKGVEPSLLERDGGGDLANAKAVHAVALYCLANSGPDNPEMVAYQRSYMDAVCHLMYHHNRRDADHACEGVAPIPAPEEPGPAEPEEPAGPDAPGQDGDGDDQVA